MSQQGVRAALLVLLALISGCVDAVSYLGLGHVFTANMTGNTVLLGMALGGAAGLSVARSATALLGFVAGAAVGAAVVRRGPDRPVWPPAVTVALALEAAALLVLAAATLVAGSPPGAAAEAGLIALSALPMGLQSTAVRRLGVSGVTTTVITSTLASAVEGLVGRLGARRREAASAGTPTWLQAAVFVAYGVGAILGAATDQLWQLRALWLPAALTGLVVLVALARFRGR